MKEKIENNAHLLVLLVIAKLTNKNALQSLTSHSAYMKIVSELGLNMFGEELENFFSNGQKIVIDLKEGDPAIFMRIQVKHQLQIE